MKITNIIEKLGNFRNEISLALADQKRKRLDTMQDALSNIKAESILQEELRKAKAKSRQDTSGASKSLLYSSISLTADSVSFALSTVGIIGCRSLHDLFNLRAVVIIFFLAFTSAALFLINNQRSYLETRFFKDAKKLNWLHAIMLIISIGGNYQFFMSVIKPKNWFDMFFVFVSACVLDALSYSFGTLGANVKFANETYSGQIKNKTVFDMIKFVCFVDFYIKLRLKHEQKLQKYNSFFGSENVLISSDEKTPILLENKDVSDNISSDEKALNMACSSETKPKRIIVSKPFRDETETKRKYTLETVPTETKNRPETETKPKRNETNSRTKQKRVSETKRNDNSFDRLVSEIKKMDCDQMIICKDLKCKLSAADWRKYRDRLVKDNVIYTKNSRTYKK